MKQQLTIFQPSYTIKEKITFFFQAIRANWFNLLFYSLIVYLPFIPVLKQHDAWLGMIPIALFFGWFLGKCIAERIWIQIGIIDLTVFPRHYRKNFYRMHQINSQQRKMFQDKYPIVIHDAFRVFRKKSKPVG